MNLFPEIEYQSEEQIRSFQFNRLNEVFRYVSENSPFYKKILANSQLSDSGFKDWEEFQKFPTTAKDDIQKYNWDFLCVPRERIIEYTSTSGTLGKPVTIPLTEKDLERLAYNEAISFACADGSRDDVYHLMLTLDRQFMAGIAYYEGIRKLGAGLIRVGPGSPAMHWETIHRLKPTCLVAVPSFIVKLIEFAHQHRIDPNASSVQKVICIGENIRTDSFGLNSISAKIRAAWNITLFGTYASTEMQTAFTECSVGRGGHHHPELVIVELLDENGTPVSEGQPGEVTITTLGVEAMPLLRYRSGDVARLHAGKCACGRNTLRIGPILGRKQQMIKLKGTTLYPPAIFDILNNVPGVSDYVVEVSTGTLGTDELKIYISSQSPEINPFLSSAFQSRLRVSPEIVALPLREIEILQQVGINRKARKFIDNR